MRSIYLVLAYPRRSLKPIFCLSTKKFWTVRLHAKQMKLKAVPNLWKHKKTWSKRLLREARKIFWMRQLTNDWPLRNPAAQNRPRTTTMWTLLVSWWQLFLRALARWLKVTFHVFFRALLNSKVLRLWKFQNPPNHQNPPKVNLRVRGKVLEVREREPQTLLVIRVSKVRGKVKGVASFRFLFLPQKTVCPPCRRGAKAKEKGKWPTRAPFPEGKEVRKDGKLVTIQEDGNDWPENSQVVLASN